LQIYGFLFELYEIKPNKLIKIMICEKVSRNDVRNIPVGQIGVFVLPNAKAVEVAKVQFSTMKRLEDMDFERVETGEPLTVAYRRIK
jgi:hypothetical protein